MPRRVDQHWEPPHAAWQRGLFTAAQARAAGMSARQTAYRRQTGVWVTVAGAGIRLAAHEPDRDAGPMAVALTWPDAVVCGPAAARFHGAPAPVNLMDAWTPVDRRPLSGLVAHRFPLDESDVLTVAGMRVLAPEPAYIDALRRLPERDAVGLFAWLITRQRLGGDALVTALARQPRTPGNAVLAGLVARADSGALSPAEDVLHEILADAQIVGWQPNVPVRDARGIIGVVDVLFAAERLALEVDGRSAHGREQFQADRSRQNRLIAAGYLVLRFTWQDLTRRPRDVASQIAAILRTRRGGSRD